MGDASLANSGRSDSSSSFKLFGLTGGGQLVNYRLFEPLKRLVQITFLVPLYYVISFSTFLEF